MSRQIRRISLAGALGALVLLSACGQESEPGTATEPAATVPSSTPSTSSGSAAASSPTAGATTAVPSPSVPADAPACASVWKKGAALPSDYAGCLTGAGVWVEADVKHCSSGQQIVRHASKFWAIPGQPIKKAAGSLAQDKAYQDLFAVCTG